MKYNQKSNILNPLCKIILVTFVIFLVGVAYSPIYSYSTRLITYQMTTPAPTTTTENHLKTLEQQLPSDSTATTTSTNKPPASTSNSDETKSTTGSPATVTVNNNNNGQNDGDSVQKKIRRAERFGMPVQLSELEKRNSRAHRFGTVPSSQGSDATKKDQELKLKARAERFGIKQSMSTDENEKKKARLARFASASITDSQEEQKKKARALRFSGTQVNGSGIIQVKATIVGKTGAEA